MYLGSQNQKCAVVSLLSRLLVNVRGRNRPSLSPSSSPALPPPPFNSAPPTIKFHVVAAPDHALASSQCHLRCTWLPDRFRFLTATANIYFTGARRTQWAHTHLPSRDSRCSCKRRACVPLEIKRTTSGRMDGPFSEPEDMPLNLFKRGQRQCATNNWK
jgi:hypothetical protein